VCWGAFSNNTRPRLTIARMFQSAAHIERIARFMQVQILMSIVDFNCFKKAIPKESIGATALARAENYYGDNFPTTGEIVIFCDEPEAMDLLAHAHTVCPESFDKIRNAIRKANFRR
jgi:hypothetical protein